MTEEIKNQEDEIKKAEPSELLVIDGLCKSYGETFAFSDFSMTVPRGGIHGLLGPKGAGKTTLLEILSGSVSADGGSVLLNGRQVRAEAKDVKAKIGYMAELSPYYRDMTVSETLDFVGACRGVSSDKRYRQIKEAAELVGLDAVKGRLVGRLTSTEEKRLGLAASLLGNPSILLLDEPVPKGGKETEAEFFELLRMLGQIKTILLATSEFHVARALCEDVAILSDGKLLVKDRFESLEKKMLSTRVLHLSARGEKEALCARLGVLPGVVGCDIRPEGKAGELSIRLEYRSEQDLRPLVSATLSELGTPVLSMRDGSLTLEEVYRSLTAASAGSEKNKEAAQAVADRKED